MPRKHVRILSINGGGVRGVVPATVLKYISESTGKEIPELFDFIIGTSIGGILASGYASPKDRLNNSRSNVKFKAAEVLDMVRNNAQVAFSSKKINSNFYGPRHPRTDLDKLLEQNFKIEDGTYDLKLIDALIPIAMVSQNYALSSIDLDQAQIWFSCSRTFSNYALKDASGATSSAPTFFPPKYTRVLNQTEAKASDCSKFGLEKKDNECQYKSIDGGLFASSPTLLALYLLKKVMMNETVEECSKYHVFADLQSPYASLKLQFASSDPWMMPQLVLENGGESVDITVLSLGTGHFNTAPSNFPYATVVPLSAAVLIIKIGEPIALGYYFSHSIIANFHRNPFVKPHYAYLAFNLVASTTFTGTALVLDGDGSLGTGIASFAASAIDIAAWFLLMNCIVIPGAGLPASKSYVFSYVGMFSAAAHLATGILGVTENHYHDDSDSDYSENSVWMAAISAVNVAMTFGVLIGVELAKSATLLLYPLPALAVHLLPAPPPPLPSNPFLPIWPEHHHKFLTVVSILSSLVVDFGCTVAAVYFWKGFKDADGKIGAVHNGIITSMVNANEESDTIISKDVFGAITINPMLDHQIDLDGADDASLNYMQKTTLDFIEQHQAVFVNLTNCLQNTDERTEECNYVSNRFYDYYPDFEN